MISRALEQVKKFTTSLKGGDRALIPNFPGAWLHEKSKELCKKLIVEEYNELIEAIDTDNWEKIIDGACDLIYVVLFLCVKTNINLEPYWQEVCDNNMTKIGGPIHPETGKQLKPEGWRPPRIKELLELSILRHEAIQRRNASNELIELKTEAQPFHAVWTGLKNYEWRRNDGRAFAVGNHLLLREVTSLGKYTGREILAKITYITGEKTMSKYFPDHVVPEDSEKRWVVLSLEVVEKIDVELDGRISVKNT
jgi:NTP pyrophosphatase (non-canonical NTP hydrolase)